jgi:hypothetical protein
MDIADILSTVRAMRAIYLYLHYDNAPTFIQTARSEDALDEVWIHLIDRLSRDVDDRREKKRLAEEAAEKKRKSARFVAARVAALKQTQSEVNRDTAETKHWKIGRSHPAYSLMTL